MTPTSGGAPRKSTRDISRFIPTGRKIVADLAPVLQPAMLLEIIQDHPRPSHGRVAGHIRIANRILCVPAALRENGRSKNARSEKACKSPAQIRAKKNAIASPESDDHGRAGLRIQRVSAGMAGAASHGVSRRGLNWTAGCCRHSGKGGLSGSPYFFALDHCGTSVVPF